MGTYIGRRGGFLLLFGIAWVAIGLAIQPPPPSRTVLFPHELIPWPARLVIWLAGAVPAIICSPMRKPGKDRWGFILLCIPVAIRAVSYFIGVIEGLFIPEYQSLVGIGFAGGVVYSVVLGAIMLVAGWPEPRPEIIRPWLNPKIKGG